MPAVDWNWKHKQKPAAVYFLFLGLIDIEKEAGQSSYALAPSAGGCHCNAGWGCYILKQGKSVGGANSSGTYGKDQPPASLLCSYTQRAHREEERNQSWETAVLNSGTRTYKPCSWQIPYRAGKWNLIFRNREKNVNYYLSLPKQNTSGWIA